LFAPNALVQTIVPTIEVANLITVHSKSHDPKVMCLVGATMTIDQQPTHHKIQSLDMIPRLVPSLGCKYCHKWMNVHLPWMNVHSLMTTSNKE
jgi:hypothetical protein